MTVGCVLIPRFSLIAALGDRREMLAQPLALAPEPGGEQAVGEISGAAEAFGVRPAMPLSEALARCPGLVLVPPDPGRAEALWERSLGRLEGIGAEVEPARPGEAFFSITALLRILGPEPERVLARIGKALDPPARLGGGPTRLCAYAVASAARARSKPVVVPRAMARSWLEPRPISLLRDRLAGPPAEVTRLIATLERLGVTTLGDLAGLPRFAVADRFGELGLRARALAAGADAPLRPRRPQEQLVQAVNLPESAYGTQLDRALELLVERLLADRRRRGRSIRLLRLEARLAAGGSWQIDVPMRSATASAERIVMAAGLKLALLPAPASSLALRALELGEEASGSQASLGDADDLAERRAALLAEAVRQARAGAGRDALLRVVEVEPDSRIPERRAMLVPHS